MFFPLQGMSAEPAAVDETQVIAQDPDAESTEIVPASPAATPSKPVSLRLQETARQLLASVPAPPSPITINVQGQEILGFWHADASGKPVGAILMLHDHADSPRKPDTLLNLHRVLPQHGWSTLSIQLPPLNAVAPPFRTRPVLQAVNPVSGDIKGKGDGEGAADKKAASERTDQAKTEEKKVDETEVVHAEADSLAADVAATAGAGESAPPPVMTDAQTELLTLAIMQAGLDYLQNEKQFNVILLGEGLGAVRALQFAGKAQLGKPPKQSSDGSKTVEAVMERPIRAIVMVNADFSERGTEPAEKWLIYPEIPTLDLITSVDLEVRAEAEERKRMSQKKQYKTYVLRRLMPLEGGQTSDAENHVTKSIRGFLAQHARGVEI
jgi:Protein of unknown function (DUF3530)